MKTLIITGGMIEADFALSFIQKLKPDYILGVDKGLQFCYEYDIRPDYIVFRERFWNVTGRRERSRSVPTIR